jgi:glycosyltransferase involved in cell wall biosynthesis
MRLLFVHQSFPGQFVHLAPALAADPGNEVIAFTMQQDVPENWNGIRMVSYLPTKGSTLDIHPWVLDFEPKVIRGEAAFRAALSLRQSGFSPDVIIAHPAWGDSLFLKDVWPTAKLGIYCEFFYNAQGADVGFDPEFPVKDPGEVCRLRLKNLGNLLHFECADAGISPTYWQASTFPDSFRDKITVVHDGINCDILAPNPAVSLTLNGSLTLTKQDEVITFVNRNLEPYRGYHIFMRALPEILRCRPNAQVLIVGGEGVSYGTKPEDGRKWKDIFVDEMRDHIAPKDWERVHFLGNIPYEYFIPLLQLSTVHVYLTYPFVLSWSLLEAMSVGCAIVASDTQPLLEAISHDSTGRLVNFFDPQALAVEVCELLDNSAERARLGANAREFAKANYDLNTICLPKQLAWVRRLASG